MFRKEKKEEFIKQKNVEKIHEKKNEEIQQAEREEKDKRAIEEYERWLVNTFYALSKTTTRNIVGCESILNYLQFSSWFYKSDQMMAILYLIIPFLWGFFCKMIMQYNMRMVSDIHGK